MTADASVINGSEPIEAQTAPPAEPMPAQPRPVPKSPITRKQVDELGRMGVKAVAGLARTVAGLARYGARVAGQGGRAIGEIPAAVRLLFVVAMLMLLGVVGSIALSGTLALVCAVVVVPVTSIALGALGHRWYSRHDGERPQRSDTRQAEVASTDLARSVAYVDTKLTLALNTFGSERHQQAVIALFQAKTAVELALGTDQDVSVTADAPVPVDEYRLRPRIQAGSASLAAS